jgi:hypothetical protein
MPNVAFEEKSERGMGPLLLARIRLTDGRPERRPPRERLLKHHDKA